MTQSQPDGYLALPASGTGPGVLVCHAWWGLNATIKAMCDRLAAEGFVAFAPDLYRGEVADTIPGAQELGTALQKRGQEAGAEAVAAARFLYERVGRPERGIAAIGFSLGASFAVDLASTLPDIVRAVVVFYGAAESDYTASQASYLGHWAENDQYEEREYIDAMHEGMKAAGRPVAFHTYPGTGHWFAEPDRADVYDQQASDLAWDRTLAFLREHIS